MKSLEERNSHTVGAQDGVNGVVHITVSSANTT